jgi:hypothetical protein
MAFSEAQSPFFSFRLLFGVKIAADEPIKPIPTMPTSAATPDSILPINNSPAAIPQIANPVMKRILIVARPPVGRIASCGLRVSTRPYGLFSAELKDIKEILSYAL